MNINIIYFASMRDQAKKSKETISTNAQTAKEVFYNLNKKYNFDFNEEDLKVAVNEEYSDFSTQLKDNDTIVFIPPVAGG